MSNLEGQGNWSIGTFADDGLRWVLSGRETVTSHQHSCTSAHRDNQSSDIKAGGYYSFVICISVNDIDFSSTVWNMQQRK